MRQNQVGVEVKIPEFLPQRMEDMIVFNLDCGSASVLLSGGGEQQVDCGFKKDHGIKQDDMTMRVSPIELAFHKPALLSQPPPVKSLLCFHLIDEELKGEHPAPAHSWRVSVSMVWLSSFHGSSALLGGGNPSFPGHPVSIPTSCFSDALVFL